MYKVEELKDLRMLKEKDIARMLSCSQRTVKRHTEAGRLTYTDFCNSRRYPA